MTCLANSSAFFKPELSASSTGTGPDGWRLWWRERAQVDGTDWVSLHRQLAGAWRALRSLADETSS
jgi:hypothetical protein